MAERFIADIGLEIHAQLMTETKIFCGCANRFGGSPNAQTCPVCLGLPGALPVLNKKVIEYAVRIGLATNCAIAENSVFARKNYFYPDLPKGYQISQYELPVCHDGWLEIEAGENTKKIRINRIHLEEDAGKSVHDEAYVDDNASFIDLNRCGAPLVEIVTEPDFSSPLEVVTFLRNLRQLVRYLGICDGNMEEGSLRCDANISLRESAQNHLGVKTELKNMNSFKSVERALEFEIKRQRDLLEAGETVDQATLLWDADMAEARIMRTKEEEHDYRYFPEPDLVPVFLSESWIDAKNRKLPELPQIRAGRFKTEFGLSAYDAGVLTAEKALADYFEEVAREFDDAKMVANWITGELLRNLHEKNIPITDFSVKPAGLSELLKLIRSGEISNNAAKKIFAAMIDSGKSPQTLAGELNLRQVSDTSAVEEIVRSVLAEHPEEVAAYRQGKKKLLGFFMGNVMRASGGKANPAIVNKILSKTLDNN